MSDINPKHDENEDVELNSEDLKQVAGGSSFAGQSYFSAQSAQSGQSAAEEVSAQSAAEEVSAQSGFVAAADAADGFSAQGGSGSGDGSDRFSGS